MEENDNNLDNHRQDHFEKSIEAISNEKELKIKWQKDIDGSQAAQNYFKDFNPISVKNFISFYLHKKYLAHLHADFYKSQLEKMHTKWIDLANNHLECILQKKLFDMQCLWRAEKIKIAEVKVSYDFLVWENDIFNCPFLEPITDSDIKLYIDFLSSGQATRNDFFSEWQDYDLLKEEYLSGDDDCIMPYWYEYHNLRTGNSTLFLLADVKGDKEQFYINLVNAAKRAKNKEIVKDNPIVLETRPSLYAEDMEVLDDFSKRIETSEEYKKIKNFQEYNNKFDLDDSGLQELIWEMAEVEDMIPIESHYDFRQALDIAYNKYYFAKIAEHIKIAHQHYLFNKSMLFSTESINGNHAMYLRFRNDYCKTILDGREINNEPRNFNF